MSGLEFLSVRPLYPPFWLYIILNMTQLAPIIKSPSDSRIYRAIRLDNELECLLIHDPDALKSSAALSMGVGSFKDPSSTQGLAHYLEHMLFMGTQKYPEENDYSNFITKNAGSNNAYTSQEETNYMLEVSSTAFEGALDRFAQFFIAPLLSEKSAEKEINAVDSEHQKNILNDAWRKYQLTKHLAKEGHPYHKFSTGNKGTLMAENLQTMLSEFYNQNYSANLMKLVIYGQEPIETLEIWAKDMFSAIPNKRLERFRITEQPFDRKSFGKLVKIVPIKDSKKLELKWVLPNKKQHYRNHPGNYISNLIGHEGKGSLLSYLMKEGLATGLNSGNYDSYNCYTEMEISIELTDRGLDRIQDIINYVLYYLHMLKEKGCPQSFFEELKLINKLKFEFLDKRKGMMETAHIAKEMHDRKIEEICVYPYLMEEWKPELINEYLNQMTTDNLIVLCQAQKFEAQCTLEEPVYKTKYCVQELVGLAPAPCDVSLPEPNIFLPKDLSVIANDQEKLPQLIYKSDFIETYFKQDHIFKLPKANISIRLMFEGNFSALEDVGRAILLDMLKEHLRQFVYLAAMAEIEVNITFVSYFSLELKFKGFRDSLKLFIVEYLRRVFEFLPEDKQLFQTLVEKHKRKYSNAYLEDPYRIVYGKIGQAMRSNHSFEEEQKLAELEGLTLERVALLNRDWKKRLIVESYFSGNITSEESVQISKSVQAFLSTHSRHHKREETGQLRAVRLEENQVPIIELQLRNAQEQNSAVAVHFQMGQLTLQSQILLKLCESVAKEPAFDYLRTQQQLGYTVFCLSEDHRGAGGLTIIVQSAVKSPFEVNAYIDVFINEKLRKILHSLTEEEFNNYKVALKNIKEEKDKNLASEANKYWGEITKHKYIFDRKQQQIAFIPTITLQDFLKFTDRFLYESPRKIELHCLSQKKLEANKAAKEKKLAETGNIRVFANTESFSRSYGLYPDFYAPQP